jgi:hypothetical protein
MHPTRRPFTSLLALTVAALATHAPAHAQAPLTRADVVAQYAQAVRTGDILAPGDSGRKLNELYPERYPKPAAAPTLSRAQVVAELQAATLSGDVLAPGDSGRKLNEQSPQRYPAPTAVAGKTRDEVRAETREAIRTGDMLASGDSGLKLNELYPQRYAKAAADRNGRHTMASAQDIARDTAVQ